MKVETEVVSRGGAKYMVALVPSVSNPSTVYRVDVTNGRCDCPAWKFSKSFVNGQRRPCKHLIQLGYTEELQLSLFSSPVTASEKQASEVAPSPSPKMLKKHSWLGYSPASGV